jgi:hypothetical protein
MQLHHCPFRKVVQWYFAVARADSLEDESSQFGTELLPSLEVPFDLISEIFPVDEGRDSVKAEASFSLGTAMSIGSLGLVLIEIRKHVIQQHGEFPLSEIHQPCWELSIG